MFSRGQKVSRVLAKYDGEKAVIEIDNILSPMFEKKQKKLRLPERHVCLIEMLEREVNSGGFDGFYFNASGDYASEIYDALDAVGSSVFKEIMFESMQAFRGMVPKDRSVRQKYMEDYEEECGPIWEPLDERFYKYDEDIHKLLLDYVRAHILDFR